MNSIWYRIIKNFYILCLFGNLCPSNNLSILSSMSTLLAQICLKCSLISLLFSWYLQLLQWCLTSVVFLYQASQSCSFCGPMLESNYLHILSNFLVTYDGRVSVDFVILSGSETDFPIYFFNAMQSN